MSKITISWLYLALGFAQAAHSIEEVITGLWRWMPLVSAALRSRTGWTPLVVMSEQTFIIGNMVIIALMLGSSPFVFLNQAWAWKIVTVVAVVETVNALNHIGGAIVTGGYFSGCVTAVLLLGLSIPIWARQWIWRKEAK